MQNLMYFLPLLFIAGGLYYSYVARKNIQAQVAAGNGPDLFHNGFAHYFPALADDERLVSVWNGTVYTGEESTAAAAVKGLANVVARHAVGVSAYVPTVHVGLTTLGRVLISEEHSIVGQRGNYRAVHSWEGQVLATTTASPDGTLAKGEDGAPIHLAQLQGPDGNSYQAWLRTAGFEVLHLQGRAISSVLPTTAADCQARWTQAKTVPH